MALPDCHHYGGLRLDTKFEKCLQLHLILLSLCLPYVGSANPLSGTASFIFDKNRMYGSWLSSARTEP